MKSLQTKITATYVTLAVILVVSVSVISSSRLDSYFQQQLVNDLNRQAELISYFLQTDSTLSFRAIDGRVKKISGIENLRITLISANGNVLADSDVPPDRLAQVENHLQRPEIQQSLTQPVGVDRRHSATVGRDFLYIARVLTDPVKVAAFPNLKFVRLSMPLEQVAERVKGIHTNIYVVGLVVLVLVTGISTFVSRRIAKPLVDITQSLEQIRSGNLQKHVNASSRDEVGQVGRAVNELVDKLNADREELEKLQRIRSEFLANVSHELRTPIFAIQGLIETLLNGAVNDPKVNRSFLEKAQSNAMRLDALLTDLINISQIESGEMRMSFRYFSVNEFLGAVAKDFQPAAEQRRISLMLDLKTAASTQVFGDRERLHQVMTNLVENGLRYNREGGEVRISTEELNGMVRIGVADTGIGIAAEHLPRIFERFYRVDKDRSREVGGTGLGLAIVKHILEAHDSKAEVESVSGQGSSFRFALKRG